MQSWVAGDRDDMGSRLGDGDVGTVGLSLWIIVINLLRKI